MALREAAQWVQQYQTMAERVRMATESVDEFEMVQKRLQATADGTYRALSEAQELYIRTADSLRLRGLVPHGAQAVRCADVQLLGLGQPARHGVRDRASAGRYRLHVLRVRHQRDQR